MPEKANPLGPLDELNRTMRELADELEEAIERIADAHGLEARVTINDYSISRSNVLSTEVEIEWLDPNPNIDVRVR